MNALQSAQNSDSFRLQQLYQSIRNLEALLAKKRRALSVQREARLVSRLIRSPQPRTIQLAAKIATAVESRSLRELQSLLFKLKRQYRTLHKRYSQIYGFSSYAHPKRSISVPLALFLAFSLIVSDAELSDADTRLDTTAVAPWLQGQCVVGALVNLIDQQLKVGREILLVLARHRR